MNNKIMVLMLIPLLLPAMIVPAVAVGPKNSDGKNPNVEVFPPITRLLLHKIGDVKILTASPRGTEEWKDADILENFGDIPIIHSYDTPKHVYSNDGILVDDALHNIYGHVENSNHKGILLNHHERYQ